MLESFSTGNRQTGIKRLKSWYFLSWLKICDFYSIVLVVLLFTAIQSECITSQCCYIQDVLTCDVLVVHS